MKNIQKFKYKQCNLSNSVRYSGLLIKFVQMRYVLVITLDWSSFWSFFIEFKSEKVRTSIPNRRKSHFFRREKWIYFEVWLKFSKNFTSKEPINFLWHFNQWNYIFPQYTRNVIGTLFLPKNADFSLNVQTVFNSLKRWKAFFFRENVRENFEEIWPRLDRLCQIWYIGLWAHVVSGAWEFIVERI